MGRTRAILSRLRLPIPPLRREREYTRSDDFVKWVTVEVCSSELTEMRIQL